MAAIMLVSVQGRRNFEKKMMLANIFNERNKILAVWILCCIIFNRFETKRWKLAVKGLL